MRFLKMVCVIEKIIIDIYCSKYILSNLYKMTTLGTTQKSSSWTDGHLIKHLYKTATKPMWSFLAGF